MIEVGNNNNKKINKKAKKIKKERKITSLFQ